MRNFKVPAAQPLLQPATETPAIPMGRIVVSPGLVTYRHVPVHAYPDGTSRGVHTAPGFGSLYRAGRP